MEKRSQGVVEAIIKNSENKILLLKRSQKNDHFKEIWQLPGGKQEINESFKDAIEREVLEETNCVCSNLKEKKSYFFNTSFNGFKGSLKLKVYTCSLEKCSNIKLSSDHLQYGFFSKSEIKKMDLTPTSMKSIFA